VIDGREGGRKKTKKEGKRNSELRDRKNREENERWETRAKEVKRESEV